MNNKLGEEKVIITSFLVSTSHETFVKGNRFFFGGGEGGGYRRISHSISTVNCSGRFAGTSVGHGIGVTFGKMKGGEILGGGNDICINICLLSTAAAVAMIAQSSD